MLTKRRLSFIIDLPTPRSTSRNTRPGSGETIRGRKDEAKVPRRCVARARTGGQPLRGRTSTVPQPNITQAGRRQETQQRKESMEKLTTENAAKAVLVQNIEHPEWGVKKFNYNGQALNNGKRISTFGAGCNTAILSEDEYGFWQVIKSA